MKVLQENPSVDNNMKKRIYIGLAVMICIQLAVIVYCFACKKQGYHSDEIWSYGYANSYYQKDIYLNSDGTSRNIGEWTKGSVLKDYLVVNDGEQFEYDSIYQNQIKDLSPPFHSMMLHTICSFFPNSFSRWYSFSINIVSFLLCMIYLYRVAALLLDEKRALYVCAIYGFCRAAIDNFCYLRMYAFCTALVLIEVYYMLRVMGDEEKKAMWKHILILFIVSFIAFLTHYYMISTAGILTACMCFYLLCQRKIKKMFQLGFAMLGSLIVSFIVFPSILSMSQSQAQTVGSANTDMSNYDFDMRNRILWNFITSKTVGIKISVFKSNWYMIVISIIVVAIIMSVPVIFLFRDTKLVKNCMGKIICFIKNSKEITRNQFGVFLHKTNWMLIVLFIVCIGQVIVVGQTSNVYGMGNYEDRYLFYLSPLFVIVCVGIVTFVCKKLPGIKKIQRWIVMGLCLFVIAKNLFVAFSGSYYYFDHYAEGEKVENVLENRNVVFVERVDWLLTTMCPYLMSCNEYLMVDESECMNDADFIREKMQEGEVLVMIDVKNYQTRMDQFEDKVSMDNSLKDEYSEEGFNKDYYELESFLENLDDTTEMKMLGETTFQGRTMRMFVINPQ